jgi:hypothetical protein
MQELVDKIGIYRVRIVAYVKMLQAIELHSGFLCPALPCPALFGRSSGIILARGCSHFQSSPSKFYTSSIQHHLLKNPNIDMKLQL